ADRSLHMMAVERCLDGDAAPGFGCLDRVRDEVAEDASQREAVAFDGQPARRVPPLDRDELPLALRPHGLADVADEAIEIEREALDRLRLDDVAQIVEEALDRLELAVDDAAAVGAALRVDVLAQQQPRVVADVLNRMQQVVDEA